MISPHESKYNPCLKSAESNSKLLLKGQNDGTWNLYVMLAALYFYDKVWCSMPHSREKKSLYRNELRSISGGVVIIQLKIMSPVEYKYL